MKKILMPLLLVLLVAMCGCGEKSKPIQDSSSVSMEPYVAALPGEYDSADTAIVTKVSELTNSITFTNYDLAKNYTLTYDSATRFTDKYGSVITASQLKQGSLADIKFLKSGKLLTDLSENTEAFYLEDITGFNADAATKVFTYKSDKYKISSNTLVLDGNQQIGIGELDSTDSVTVMGVDNVIYSICLNSSHGYLQLKGEERFIDAILEIGLKQAEIITENFLLAISEGVYDINVVKGKDEFKSSVKIEKGKTTTLDLSGFVLTEEKRGYVFFDTTPNLAKVYVDDKVINKDKLQELTLGRHKVEAKAEGYEDFVKFFNVAEGKATLDVTLKEVESQDKKDSSADSSNTDGYFVFITAPTGVEVTVDGSYVGLTPLSFAKKAGSHTIALRKNGCVSRSYTVNVENTAKDVYYTFEELALESDISTNNTEP